MPAGTRLLFLGTTGLQIGPQVARAFDDAAAGVGWADAAVAAGFSATFAKVQWSLAEIAHRFGMRTIDAAAKEYKELCHAVGVLGYLLTLIATIYAFYTFVLGAPVLGTIVRPFRRGPHRMTISGELNQGFIHMMQNLPHTT